MLKISEQSQDPNLDQDQTLQNRLLQIANKKLIDKTGGGQVLHHLQVVQAMAVPVPQSLLLKFIKLKGNQDSYQCHNRNLYQDRSLNRKQNNQRRTPRKLSRFLVKALCQFPEDKVLEKLFLLIEEEEDGQELEHDLNPQK